MKPPVALVVLCRGRFASDALQETLASVRASSTPPAAIVGCMTTGDCSLANTRMLEGAGISVKRPLELLASAEVLGFVCPGDRLRPGALDARLRPLVAHPTAVMSVAGHVLVDDSGQEVLAVPAPSLPADPVELLLRPRLEPAGVLVKTEVLDAVALELVTRPHGDAVVWSRLAGAHGFIRSGEVAAEVLVDAERHGHAPRARARELFDLVTLHPPDESGAVTLRRELLRRLYLEPDPEVTGVALSRLLGDDPSRATAEAVVADLEWALERQRAALSAERVRWPIVEDDDVGSMPAEELPEARAQAAALSTEIQIQIMNARRLEAEVYQRDAIIADLTASPLGASADEER